MLFQSGLLDSKGNVARHPAMPHVRTVKEGYLELFGKEPSGTVWEAIKGMVAVNTLGKSFWALPVCPRPGSATWRRDSARWSPTRRSRRMR